MHTITINNDLCSVDCGCPSTAPIAPSSLIFSNSVLLELEIEVCHHIDDERKFSHDMWRELMNIGNPSVTRNFILQAGNGLPVDILHKIRAHVVGMDDILSVGESLLILWYYLRKASTASERIMAFTTFCKCSFKDSLTATVLLSSQFEKLFDMLSNDLEMEVQSLENIFDVLRGYMNNFEMLKKMPLYKKLYKFFLYALSLSLFEKFNITFDTFSYSKIEEEAIKKKYHTGVDFAYTVADTLLFLCERGYQCMKTGSLDPLYHSDTSYQKWYEKYALLKRQSNFLSTPELHGINLFTYVGDLDDCLDQGRAITKFASIMVDFEKSTIRSALNDLEMIKATFITKRAAQRDRRAPYAPIVCGGSSVAKSAMMHIIYAHIAKVYKNPMVDGSRYTRNPFETHWNGLTTAAWCIQIDDVAFIHPNAAQGIDPTMGEVIAIKNNMSFVPEQADLPDKGKIAVKPDLFISSTNTEHLNAHAYFAYPLAVKRRFDVYICIKPKPEYIRDECMIDGSKIPLCVEGRYPNLWNFILKRAVPAGGDHSRGQLVEITRFEDIDDFLQWLAIDALRFRDEQYRVMNSNENNTEVEICDVCYRSKLCCSCETSELQTGLLDYGVAFGGGFMSNLFMWYMMWYLRLYLRSRIIARVLDFFRFGIITTWLISFCPAILPEVFRVMGGRVNKHIGIIKEFTVFIGFVAVGGFLGHMFQKYYYSDPVVVSSEKDLPEIQAKVMCPLSLSTMRGSPPNEPLKIVHTGMLVPGVLDADEPDFNSEVQNEPSLYNSISEERGSMPEPAREERNNVWYKNDFIVSNFDVSTTSLSQVGITTEQICTRLLRNCVQFIPAFEIGNVPVTRPTKAICVGGHIYMCNNHGLPVRDSFQLTIISAFKKDGVTPNITIRVDESMIRRYPERDICFINIRSIPPGPLITSYFCKKSLMGIFKGWYLSKGMNGAPSRVRVDNIRRLDHAPVPQLGISVDSWFGVAAQPTVKGDCGSMLLAESSFGPIILGFHYLGMGGDNRIGSIMITDEFVQAGINSFDEIIIQSGEPQLSAPSAPRTLGPLHNKSVFRYINKGTANVYGSFDGFKPSPTSHVAESILAPSMVKRGCVIKHGPPVMKGYEIWRNAAIPLTNPTTQMNQEILAKCVKSFTKEILNKLPGDQLKLIKVYDNFTALNGAAGIAYVDKVNRNTSIGCPWKKGKKFFLSSIPEAHDLPDPVEYDIEIMSRVDNHIFNYEEGRRCMPVFCGNAKDEAKKFAHIAAAKTRIFLGAPGDWSLVNRKYLLSVIRVIQNNRFIFESGPGTIAQSLEWEEIREFLIQHGLERLIAGDYKNFDKEMAAIMILAAFDIIIEICRAAGYTEDELRVVKGIAEDTAFPLMDFNGDLVETFGGNPSGHPLTVIINGLVNSLYLRYVFEVLRRSGKLDVNGFSDFTGCEISLDNFQKLIALMTYGDDNAMGVSSRIPGFNHTSIQSVLSDIGITYTMAEKDAVSKPFIHIDDVSFLKRTWKFDKDVGAYLAPLEEESIIKSLTVNVISKSVTPEVQAIAVISTALREYFFYGKEIFHEKTKMFKEIVEENNLQAYVEQSTFPTWIDLKNQFWANSVGVELKCRKAIRV